MNLEDCGILKEDILNGVVKKLTEEFDQQELYQALQTASSRIEREAERIVTSKIAEKVDEMLSREFQPVDIWGDKVGGPTTISNIVERSLQNWWTATVGEDGKPVGRSHYGKKMPRAEYIMNGLITPEVRRLAEEDIRKVVSETKGQMSKQFQAALANIVRNAFR